MAKKRDLTKKQQDMIDKAFSGVDLIYVDTDFGKVGLISLEEMPMQQMTKFMTAPNETRMATMVDFIKMCLVNPSDWEKISDLPVKKLNRIIQSWMVGSSTSSSEEEE